jgi:Asp-tRNA(Asn)/Glu-tRNA(Gln) amidotransferase A subunit family amidase
MAPDGVPAAALADPTSLTAGEALDALARGSLTPAALWDACQTRIARRDKGVRAWAALATDPPPLRAGPLAGLPVGIKDVFDTACRPTTHNSPLFAGHRPSADAAAVSLLRSAGAWVLGKTDTTEFAAAGRDAVTGNPHDLAHTPGGSSAGSAAAVADGHVPLALGTQTGGSTIRPGSYCGVFAFKPSFGLVSTEGMKRYAPSFDTVGWYARAVSDLALVARAFALPDAAAPSRPPRLGLCLTPYADRLAPESRAAVDRAAAAFRAAGAEVTLFDLPDEMQDLDALHRQILQSEGSVAFRSLAARHPALLHDDFHARVTLREGAANGYALCDIFAAQDRLALHRIALDRLTPGFDALIAPAAPGYAPLGRGPGDPVFNALWTALQRPVVALPARGPDDPLPIGVSLVGARGGDMALLALAERLAPALPPGARISPA